MHQFLRSAKYCRYFFILIASFFLSSAAQASTTTVLFNGNINHVEGTTDVVLGDSVAASITIDLDESNADDMWWEPDSGPLSEANEVGWEFSGAPNFGSADIGAGKLVLSHDSLDIGKAGGIAVSQAEIDWYFSPAYNLTPGVYDIYWIEALSNNFEYGSQLLGDELNGTVFEIILIGTGGLIDNLDYGAPPAPGDPNVSLKAFRVSHFENGERVFHLTAQQSVVPIPAAIWLFGSALLGMVSLTRRKLV